MSNDLIAVNMEKQKNYLIKKILWLFLKPLKEE